MDPSVLLQKLIEIERSIGVEMESTIRRRVLEVQAYILSAHWNAEDHLRRREEYVEPCEKVSVFHRVSKPN